MLPNASSTTFTYDPKINLTAGGVQIGEELIQAASNGTAQNYKTDPVVEYWQYVLLCGRNIFVRRWSGRHCIGSVNADGAFYS